MPEEDSGYVAYVKYLYDRDVAPAVSRYRASGRPAEENYYDFEYPLGELAQADATLRLIATTPDVYRTFRAEALAALLRVTAGGVEANSRALDELGFEDILDSEYPILAKGLRPEHLPPGEAEVLRMFGFPEAADHLPGLIYLVREHAETFAARDREVPPSTEMRNLLDRLNRAAEDHKRLGEIEEEIAALQHGNDEPPQQLRDEAESKRKPRRWWKGIGQIVQGAGISLGDAAVAVGLGTAGVAPAWSALISVTVGVGNLMTGIGELRGE